jgi:hypothetical protein
MSTALTPLALVDMVGFTIRILAVAGGAVLGALLTGGLGGFFIRSVTTRRAPDWVRRMLRTLGGIAAGLLAALFLFGGGGGSGFGGTGGWGFGGTGTGPGTKATGEVQDDGSQPKIQDSGNPLSSPSSELRVEVLGNEPIRRFTGNPKADLTRSYRIEGETPTRLHNLAEVKKMVEQRLAQQPKLKRIDIIVYRDSPSSGERVTALESGLKDLALVNKEKGFEVAVQTRRDEKAPER